MCTRPKFSLNPQDKDNWTHYFLYDLLMKRDFLAFSKMIEKENKGDESLINSIQSPKKNRKSCEGNRKRDKRNGCLARLLATSVVGTGSSHQDEL